VSIWGISGVPLSYIIWKEEFSGIAPPGEDGVEELIHLAPLYGTAYLEDKKRVYCIIRDAVSWTDGWTWMQDVWKEDGRQAMKHLCDHYNGPGAKTHCIQDAKECLKICVYKSKTMFSFEPYVSILKECFATLKEDERVITKRDKLDYLLDSIKNTALAVAVSTTSMLQTLQTSFKEAVGILLHEVQQLLPLAANHRKRTIHKWKPNTMALVEAVEVAMEEIEANCKEAEEEEKEAKEAAKVAVESKEAK